MTTEFFPNPKTPEELTANRRALAEIEAEIAAKMVALDTPHSERRRFLGADDPGAVVAAAAIAETDEATKEARVSEGLEDGETADVD